MEEKQRRHLIPLTREIEVIIRERYDSHPTTVKELMAEFGVERWRLHRWVKELGLARTMRYWTPREDDYLTQHVASLPQSEIARRLNRSERSVRCRMDYLGITKGDEGYTLRSLAESLGCGDRRVRSWIAQGWLKARKRQTLRSPEEDPWLITDQDIADFFWEYGHVIPTKPLTPARWLWLWNLLREAEKPGSRRKRQAG